MKNINYQIAKSFFKLLASLPFPVLYAISDFLYFVLFYLIKYRRQVVRKNLISCFPDKSLKEIEQIEKKYYKHLSDLIVESLKSFKISEAQLKNRIKFNNPDFFREILKQYSRVIVVMGHTGNWEWAGLLMGLSSPAKHFTVYRPIKNSLFDRLMYDMRSSTGTIPVPMQMIGRYYLETQEPSVFTFIADQNPPKESASWHNFFGKETPFFRGYEKLALKKSAAVVFVYICKIKRGYYEIFCEKLPPNKSYSGSFAELLEKSIRRQPYNWLWSHKRWKYTRN